MVDLEQVDRQEAVGVKSSDRTGQVLSRFGQTQIEEIARSKSKEVDDQVSTTWYNVWLGLGLLAFAQLLGGVIGLAASLYLWDLDVFLQAALFIASGLGLNLVANRVPGKEVFNNV